MEYDREWVENAIVKIKDKSQTTKAEAMELTLQIHEHDLKVLIGCTAWSKFAPEQLGVDPDRFFETVACAKFQRWARQRFGWNGTITIQALHSTRCMSDVQIGNMLQSIGKEDDINNYILRAFNKEVKARGDFERKCVIDANPDEEWFLRRSLTHVRKHPEVLDDLLAKRDKSNNR